MLQWIGTILVVAMQFAIHFELPRTIVVVLSIASAVVWTIAAIKVKNKALVVTNATCLVFGIIGLIK